MVHWICRSWMYVALLGCSSQLMALPSNGQVIRGDAAITSNDRLMAIDVKERSVLSWESFDIEAGESVHFSQLNEACAVLNQIQSGKLSKLLGHLSSNGQVILVNSKGFLFGPKAKIETTGGFIAATSQVSEDSFFSGKELFLQDLGDGEIVHLGSIHSENGDIALIGKNIKTEGLIEAPNGSAILAEGAEILIQLEHSRKIIVKVDDLVREGNFEVGGTIAALEAILETGSIYSHAIRQTGTISCLSRREENGRIYLAAPRSSIEIEGTLSAPKGEVHLFSKELNLKTNSLLDVSSDIGGGQIRIDEHSTSIAVQRGARLQANAKDVGNGGEIHLIAGQKMMFLGQIEAKGGKEGGDGGFVEISSKGSSFCMQNPHRPVDVTAPKGRIGKLLLDPKIVHIAPGGISPVEGNLFASDPSGFISIDGATLSAAIDAADVTIQANTDILFDDIVIARTPGRSLHLQAGRTISFRYGGGLTLNQGDFVAVINHEGADPANRDGGIARFRLTADAGIFTQGGNVFVDIGSFAGQEEGQIELFSGQINAGGGNISIEGTILHNSQNLMNAIAIGSDAQIITEGAGNILLKGVAGLGQDYNMGIHMGGSLQAEDGEIRCIGEGGGKESGQSNCGLYLRGPVTTKSGLIYLDGTGGNGSSGNCGIWANSESSKIETDNGEVFIRGQGGGVHDFNMGVVLNAGSTIHLHGEGSLTVEGFSGRGINCNQGIFLSNSTIISEKGPIFLKAMSYGSMEANDGIRLENSQIRSEGTGLDAGRIALNGTSGNEAFCSHGVTLLPGALITSVDGDISVTGLSLTADGPSQGMFFSHSEQIVSSGVGKVTTISVKEQLPSSSLQPEVLGQMDSLE